MRDVDSNLFVITTAEEVGELGVDARFGPEVPSQLRALDYRSRFAVMVLRGALGGTSRSYAVDVLKVTRSGDRVVIDTHFGELGLEEGSMMGFSSPYHIISITKEGLRGREIHFVLKEDGRTITERSHFIP